MSDEQEVNNIGQNTVQFTAKEEGETKLLRGEKEVEVLAYAFIERSLKSFIHGLADSRIPKDTGPAIEFTKQIFKQNPNYKLQLIVDLQKKNLDYYKSLMEAGVELRHIEGNKVSFAISKDEYLATPLIAVEEQIATGAALPREIVWSTRKDVVSQFEQIFIVMWQNAMKAPLRIKELEKGIEPEETIIIEDMQKVYTLGRKMSEECKEEALLILASDKTILRNQVLFETLSNQQKEFGFRIKILTPIINEDVKHILPHAEWRKMEKSINVSILIYDRKRMFITLYSKTEARTTEEAVLTNIYSTSKPTIQGLVSVFYGLWEETELRQKEEKSRLEAQLLQDVLTHDIRNYNQVSKIAAEILIEKLKDDLESQGMAKSILVATDGSSELVDKAKKMSRLLADQGHVKLQSVDLIQSIERSLLLTKKIFPNKQIKETRKITISNPKKESVVPIEIKVLADELLDDVFLNLFSNSAKFTIEDRVSLDILIEEEQEKEKEWKITLKDSGPGIPLEQRETIFERYSKAHKGSGLGLSIVHAIVVGRYGGQVKIENYDNSPPPKTRGAVFSLTLKQGPPS